MEDQPPDGAGAPRKGAPTWMVEAGVALLVLAFGLTVLFGSRKLGSGWTTDGPGPGYFPFYIGLILCISAAGILFQALAAKKRATGIFVDKEQIKQVLMVLVPAAVYVLAVQLVGLYLASAIYIACFMALLGHYPWHRSIAVAVAIAVVFFLLFEVWFKVPLYKGALDPLGFLGY
ncbi:MAG: tripartite tricarboxylate transporter TctB family protein [Burkholderiales bacterium]|nr:tripartite tricarboxylate transporter TctB family protein [Burkholderiales bacterium]